MNQCVVNVRSLKKTYENNTGVMNATFSLYKGDILGVLGQNGAGKTTILRVLMNILNKDSGNIELFGEEYKVKEKLIKSKIGFVYDDFYYDSTHNIQKVKKYISKFYTNWDDTIFDSYMEKFQLPLNKKIMELSRGMKMKLAIAISLSHNAELLIMDEPTSGLDPIVRDEILEEIYNVNKKQNVSIIFSSHIISDVEKIANKIVIIHKGKTVINESKNNLLNKFLIIEGDITHLNPEIEQQFVKVRKKTDSFIALINSRNSNTFNNRENNFKIRKANLEEIMLLIIKGE